MPSLLMEKGEDKETYDVSILRPQMRSEDIRMRGEGIPQKTLERIKKGLLTLHTLETMAVNIYRFQITRKGSEHDCQLIAAMCNEMTHLQDFQVKLFEYGGSPSVLRWGYWIVGFGFGFFSRLGGKRWILKTGIWVEAKAVAHYEMLLRTIEWDEETRTVIEKNQADEKGHIRRWKRLLEELR